MMNNNMFEDLEIVKEKEKVAKNKEIIVNKEYQYHKLVINDMRGEYIINLILDDYNRTVKKYTITSLLVYDDESLKHFKDKDSFDKEPDTFLKNKYTYTYAENSKYIKENNIKPIRFILPSKDSYDSSLLNNNKEFINSEHNKLYNKLALNIKTLWNDCDIFSQYFKDVVYSYFYGKIYKYTNLDNEVLIENSKVVLFQIKGKAFPTEWTKQFNELKMEFRDLDTNHFDKESYVKYLKDLFNRELDVPKFKFLKLWFSKVSEYAKSTKGNKNDNECIISHLSVKNPPKLSSNKFVEDDFMYETTDIIDGELVTSKSKMIIDLGKVIALDYVYDNESQKNIATKFDHSFFDEDWYKLKIAESERLIKKYKIKSKEIKDDFIDSITAAIDDEILI